MTPEDEQLRQNLQGLLNLGHASTPYRSQAGHRFEFSFLWLKPFVKVHTRRVSEFQPLVNAEIRNPDGLPFEQLERLCLNEGVTIAWSKIAKDCGVTGIADVAIAMGSRWNAFKKPYMRPELAARLDHYLDANNIVEADDNGFSSFEIRILHRLLRDAGFTDVIHFRELVGPFANSHRSCSLNAPPDPLDVWGFNQATDSQLSFYVQTGFNDFTFVIHGPKSLADAIQTNRNIEGFFCNANTTDLWFFDPTNELGEAKPLLLTNK